MKALKSPYGTKASCLKGWGRWTGSMLQASILLAQKGSLYESFAFNAAILNAQIEG